MHHGKEYLQQTNVYVIQACQSKQKITHKPLAANLNTICIRKSQAVTRFLRSNLPQSLLPFCSLSSLYFPSAFG